ncbi:prosaposin isoform X2 [Triplophysa rosa]|uniref:prosaposin isoform X2 n=1 Tax=Triplophysa rosa TaxID=992332 RepID=UPI002545CD7A|nr:prosaposin isoform X2 [Triplophysa rosa]
MTGKLKILVFIALLGSVSMRNVQMDAEEIANGNVCQDCTQIFETLMDLLSDKDFQDRIINTLEDLCDMMPAQVTQICHTQVEKIIPIAIGFFTSCMKPDQICKSLRLCEGRDSGEMRDLLLNHISKTVTMPPMKLGASIQCCLCTYTVSTLENLFPKDKTESAITALFERLCSEFPALVQSQCNKMVEKYVKLLIDMLLNKTSPNFICTLLGLCGMQEEPIIGLADTVRSDCETCLTLAVLTRMYLSSNATEIQTASFLDSVCQMHPYAMPKCKTYARRYGKQLFTFLGKEQEALGVCKKVNLCVTGDREADPCTLGVNYRCKDLQTALNCGAVSFCQKNVWG